MIEQVYLDLDGVIVDLVKQVLRHHNKEESDLKPNVYDLGISLDVNTNEMFSNWGSKVWSLLEPTLEKDSILELISQYYDKRKIIILTKLSNSASAAGKVSWVKKHLKDYTFAITNNKCRFANQHALLIDDCDDEVNKFIACGGKAILIPRIWNSGDTDKFPLLTQLEEGLRETKNAYDNFH